MPQMFFFHLALPQPGAWSLEPTVTWEPDQALAKVDQEPVAVAIGGPGGTWHHSRQQVVLLDIPGPVLGLG